MYRGVNILKSEQVLFCIANDLWPFKATIAVIEVFGKLRNNVGLHVLEMYLILGKFTGKNTYIV